MKKPDCHIIPIIRDGKVRIPAGMRDKLGIGDGDEVEVSLRENGEIVIRKKGK